MLESPRQILDHGHTVGERLAHPHASDQADPKSRHFHPCDERRAAISHCGNIPRVQRYVADILSSQDPSDQVRVTRGVDSCPDTSDLLEAGGSGVCEDLCRNPPMPGCGMARHFHPLHRKCLSYRHRNEAVSATYSAIHLTLYTSCMASSTKPTLGATAYRALDRGA